MRFAVAVSALLSLAATLPAGAQVILGRLLEEGSDRAIAEGTIHLLDGDRNTVDLVVSNATGNFVLHAPKPGRYRLEGVRLGYASAVSQEIELEERDSVRVEFRLSPRGVPLQPLTVRAMDGKERGRDAFARRCGLGKGHCLTPDSIAKLKPHYTSDVFRVVPSLWVDYNGRVTTFKGWGCFVIFYNRLTTPLQFTTRRSNTLREPGRPRFTRPSPISRAGETLGFGVDELLADDIRGIEIYPSSADVPKELKNSIYGHRLWPAGQLGSCGAAIVWDRAGW
jgi:hypothetical protein